MVFKGSITDFQSDGRGSNPLIRSNHRIRHMHSDFSSETYNLLKTKFISHTKFVDLVELDHCLKTYVMVKREGSVNEFVVHEEFDGDRFDEVMESCGV